MLLIRISVRTCIFDFITTMASSGFIDLFNSFPLKKPCNCFWTLGIRLSQLDPKQSCLKFSNSFEIQKFKLVQK
ncbi:hypothetical protein BpHYR1_043408 [Brachionus plicatilis]|uniref:Uncharacterized protein n=1 Tax=Brachionus plicatilis TaxID=10195 RepID=A0A3M7SNC3_BRAPC|nr:hypothetical protein BpHYR1_043408 [Brachionus plicatilis]